jgi:ATP-dependent RNA/DNA helicase IGHMBP2
MSPVDLDSWFARLNSLLGRERDAEKERFADAQATLSLQERDARGTAIAQAEPVDEGALSGRYLLVLARPGNAELGASQIHSGSRVRLRPRRGDVDEKDLPEGVVSRRTRVKLSIALDQPPPDWATVGRVAVELMPHAATHERLLGAVRRMQNLKEGKRWHPILSGAPPRLETGSNQDAEHGFHPQADHFNPEQQAAIALCEQSLDVALVHGPPGTGKTTVLVELIRRAAARGEQVLACAPSNLAVDNLVERLADKGLDCVRLGHPARVLASVLEHTLEEKAKAHPDAEIARDLVKQALQLKREASKKEQRRASDRFSAARSQEREARQLFAEARAKEDSAERDVLSRAQVVLATLTGLESGVVGQRRFALAVIDEATQAVEPAAYLAMLRADRVVLAGDHLQLPPTVLAQEAGALAISLFERLQKLAPQAMVTLLLQHRMHEQIMHVPSRLMYGGKLRAHPAVANRALDLKPLQIIDTAGRGFEEETPEGSDSKRNPGEAKLCAAEVQGLIALGVPLTEIAVICPYDAQGQLIRSLIPNEVEAGLEVDTVDGFQGREKDAVIVSLVRSNDRSELGFVADLRRLNVALTRARKKLIVIGDGATLARQALVDGEFEYAKAIDGWCSAWEKDVE